MPSWNKDKRSSIHSIHSTSKAKRKMKRKSSTPRNSEAAKSFFNRKEVPQSPTNIDEITRVVGSYISEEFDCVYNNFAGKLYAGPSALLFRGRIFFFDWSVVVRWEDVIQVKKIETSVDVLVREPKGASHSFEKLFDPDKVWSSLVSLHNDNILDTPRKQATPRAMSRTLRRNNSDPYAIRALKLFYNTDEEDDDDDDQEDEKKEENDSDVSRNAPRSTIVTPAEAWSKLKNDKSSYAYEAVIDCELPCTLTSFFDLFLADDAKYSIPTFMQANGEENVNSSSWKKGGQFKSRVVMYTHPVNAPMAPPKARARKEQEYQQYENYGLVLETKTFVEDVPITDCFFVAEMIRVERLSDDKVSISMLFDIRFVKSTMFKSIITRTTKREVEKSMQELAKFMSESFGDDTPVTKPPKPSSAMAQKSQQSFDPVRVGLVMLIILLSLQLWMIRTLQSMQHEISELKLTCSTRSGSLTIDSSMLME